MNNIQHLEKVRKNHQRRLQILELQAASFGLSVPPHILMEIEDIRETIALIDAQIIGKKLTRREQTAQPKISILFLAADPTDAARLRLGEEFREIQQNLQLAKLREQFDLNQRLSVRASDISRALLDIEPEYVHFSGHGTSSGSLCFENHQGLAQPVEPEALAALFEQFAAQVRCVVLNACYSEIQAVAIAHHVPCVIGMHKAIGDSAATAFASGFYQALGAGRNTEEAYKLGCVEIQLRGISEHLTPILVRR